MEPKRFEELVLSHLARLTEDMSGLKSDVSGLKQDVSILKDDVAGLKQDVSVLKDDVAGLKQKLDLVYDHVVVLTENQTVDSKRITKVEKDNTSLAELYGKHEVEIRNIKSILI